MFRAKMSCEGMFLSKVSTVEGAFVQHEGVFEASSIPVQPELIRFLLYRATLPIPCMCTYRKCLTWSCVKDQPPAPNMTVYPTV